MKKTIITKREFDGFLYVEIVRGILEGIPENEKKNYLENFVKRIENYTFVGRKETDPNPHPTGGSRYLENIPTTKTPDGLAEIVIELLNSYYNADKSNKTKEYMLDKLSNFVL